MLGHFITDDEERASGSVRVSCSSRGSNYRGKMYDSGDEASSEGRGRGGLYFSGRQMTKVMTQTVLPRVITS